MWRSFGRHGVTYSAGEGVSKGLVYLFLILLAGVLPQRDFAYVNLYLTILGFLTTPFALGLPGALLRFFFTDRPPAVLGTAGALIVGGSLGLGIASLSLVPPAAALLDLPPLLIVLAITGAAANALRQGWLAALRAQQRSTLFAVSQLGEPLLLFAGVAVLYALRPPLGYVEVAVPYLATFLLIAAAGWFYLGRAPGLRAEPRLVRPLLALGLPLVPHAFAASGLATFDQLVVQQLLGPDATAVYAFGYRCGMALYVLVLGFSAAWGPLLFAHLSGQAPRDDLQRIARTYVNFLVLGSVLLTAVLMLVAGWIGGADYRASLPLIPLVVYGYLWFALYTLASAFLIHAGRTGTVAACSGTAFAVNALLNYLLVPSGGLAAAALVTVLSYTLLFTLVTVALRRRPPEVRFAPLASRVAGAAILFLATWLLSGGGYAPW